MICPTEQPPTTSNDGQAAQPLGWLLDFMVPFLAVPSKDWPENMEISSFNDPSEGVFTLRGECPHCRIKAAFMSVTKSWHEEGNKVTNRERWVAALRCVACHKYILGIVGFVSISDREANLKCLEYYPLGKPDQITSEEIPAQIREDFNEALRCRSVESYNATTEMCRRALQASCEEQGASPSSTIETQIEWMVSQGKITQLLGHVAHTIRLAGNRGAHPPRAITEEEADAVIGFAKEYFHAVYVSPATLKKFDFSRSGGKKTV